MVSSNDVHKLFLQAVLSRRFFSTDLGKALWKKSVDIVKAADETLDVPFAVGDAGFVAFVHTINESINGLDLELSRLHDEVTGREMYALVNRRGDEVAQIASDYSPLEIAYFKALLEQIVLAPNRAYSVSSLAALREVNQLKSSMSKTQAEAVLASFVAKGWLLKSQKGRYSLSTRTLLELNPYLTSTYGEEIGECTVCNEMTTKGRGCYTPNCKGLMHDHCYKKYVDMKNKLCPACQQDWSSETNKKKLVPIGEQAAREGDERQRHSRRSTTAGSDEEEEAEQEPGDEEDGDEDEQPAPTQGRSKKGRGAKQNGARG
ncbi:hypothetical protein FA95DRAFT_1580992 [Auriscalpium vulgare]|uniref:Uncharacterized protein n=1 Tax=Auriscalpium vulgare TaxID=40419 RepID=A0ACB8S3P3_9AGAM|nr:hypothetical protein FA95DRAFT_1580992 [Auriscalpium vulgare]